MWESLAAEPQPGEGPLAHRVGGLLWGGGGSEWFGPGRELFKLMLNIPSIPKHEMGGDRPVTLQGVGPMTLTLALTHLSSQLLEA